MTRLLLKGEGATAALAQRLAGAAPPTVLVWLRGELGAGKSTFARALLRALGVEGAIRSPTYTLVERHETVHGLALHLDLYRIADAGELEFLGLDDAAHALCLVEWPEHGAEVLGVPDLDIYLQHAGDARWCHLEARTSRGTHWLGALSLSAIGTEDGAALKQPARDG